MNRKSSLTRKTRKEEPGVRAHRNGCTTVRLAQRGKRQKPATRLACEDLQRILVDPVAGAEPPVGSEGRRCLGTRTQGGPHRGARLEDPAAERAKL